MWRMWLLLSLVWTGSSWADPYERNPYTETVVVVARWGAGEAEFSRPEKMVDELPPTPGPFYVADGLIYVADPRGDVRILSATDGSWRRTVPLPEGATPHDLVTYRGRIYWCTQNLSGVLMSSEDIETFESERILVTPNPELLKDRGGRPAFGMARLVVDQDGVSLYNRITGASYPVVRGTEVISAENQERRQSRGIRTRAGRIMSASSGSGITAAPGDIVRLTEDGRVGAVVLRGKGYLWGIAADRLIVDEMQSVEGQQRFYLVAYGLDGKLLSRTLAPVREWIPREGEAIRVTPDGDYWELYSDDTGVKVSRWSRR